MSEPATATEAPLLAVTDLRVTFHQAAGEVHAVRGLSYTVAPGGTVAIIGESGSGKSASARAVLGLLPPSAEVSGSVRFQGKELLDLPESKLRLHRGPDLAMVFQDPARSLNPTMRVGPQIAEAVRAHTGMSKKQAQARAVELLSMVRLSAPQRRYHEYPHQLSGGMRQRVMIAIALACDPKLLIADEATTALDVTTQAQIMNLLMDLRAELGMALIMISHDLGLAAHFADDVIVMYAGQAVERGATRELFTNVRMPYTRALLDAIPRLRRPPHAALPLISGRPPDLSRPITGCPFAPRCPEARERCHGQAPPLREHESGHWWACWYPCTDGGQA